MRGGTSKGCMFLKEHLPSDQKEWDKIFLQVMGDPDPKQIDGMGGTVSSNNKVVIVWKSEEENVDIEYLVGQIIVGKSQVDFKSNCGNMTAAVGPFAVEEGLVEVTGNSTTVKLLNRNTNKFINVEVPCENGSIAIEGDCKIAGVDGTDPELKVNFLNPAGAKTGVLLPTGKPLDILDIEGIGKIEATILDVSNPMVLVRAEEVGLKGTESPDEVNANKKASELLEKIRGTAACMMGFAKDLKDATDNSPAVPKVGVFTKPQAFKTIDNTNVLADEMDICVRVVSVFKCHKACPLTSASSISVAAFLEGSLINKDLGGVKEGQTNVRIGHPSGVMTMYPDIQIENDEIKLPGVAVQRTARRIMEGTVFIKD
ncbi:PrpF protein [Candidatus Epulonipiscium fishelsonii]|uniref:PrpF protein n=1 Tax=Candidatus Epulonipiscium fishelsonii TaxID=77094 RepID=A0ACC8XEW2_9FIRM|nr:PrpF protein [Epulopiscium sp. SCG-B11WGA-EpuloA1]